MIKFNHTFDDDPKPQEDPPNTPFPEEPPETPFPPLPPETPPVGE